MVRIAAMTHIVGIVVAAAIAGPWNATDGLILTGTIVTMDDTSTVVDGQLLIQGGLIVAMIGEGER